MEGNNTQIINQVTLEDLARMISQGFAEANEDREKKFGETNQRISGVETRLDGVETRLDGVETRLDGVETRLDGLDQKIDDMNIELVKVKKVVNRISEDTDALVKNFCELDTRTACLKKLPAQTGKLRSWMVKKITN